MWLLAAALGADAEVPDLAMAARDVRIRAIGMLEHMASPDNPKMGEALHDRIPELRMRLGELYRDEATFLWLQEMEASGGDVEAEEVAESNRWLTRAASAWTAVADDYPGFHRVDEALYFAGQARLRLGDGPTSAALYDRLVRDHPYSDFALFSHVQLGDWHLENRRFRAALLAYLKAASYDQGSAPTRHRLDRSDRYDGDDIRRYAISRSAVCYWNLGVQERALRSLKKAIVEGFVAERGPGDPMRGELRILMRWSAELDDPHGALEFVESLGEQPLLLEMIAQLASEFLDMGNYERSNELYALAIDTDPLHEDVPAHHARILEGLVRLDAHQRVVAQVMRVISEVGPGSAWREASLDPQTREEGTALLQRSIQGLAQDAHLRARESRRRREKAQALVDAGATGGALLHAIADERTTERRHYEVSAAAYEAFFLGWPDALTVAQLKFEYGEVMYAMSRFQEAYGAYNEAIALDPHLRDAGRTGQAAEFAVQAAREILDSEREHLGATRGAEDRLIAAVDRYVSIRGVDGLGAEYLFQAAELVGARERAAGGQRVEAVSRFERIVDAGVDETTTHDAYARVLQILEEDRQWEAMTAFIVRHQDGLEGELRQQSLNVRAGAQLKVLESAHSGDPLVHATALLDWYRTFGQTEHAGYALNLAADLFEEAGDQERAIRVRVTLVALHRDAAQHADNVRLLGYQYEKSLKFQRAAEMYELFVDVGPEQGDMRERALYVATRIRHALGNDQLALADCERFAELFPQAEGAAELRLLQMRILEDTRAPNLVTVYEAVIDDERLAPSVRAVAATGLYKHISWGGHSTLSAVTVDRKAMKLYQGARAEGDVDPLLADAIGELMYLRILPRESDFRKLEITTGGMLLRPEDEDPALSEALTAKAVALFQLETDYRAVIDTGSTAWGTMALVRLGRLYLDMAEKLEGSTRPSYLSGRPLDVYEAELADKAYIQRQKSERAYLEAVLAAREVGSVTPASQIAIRQLRALPGEEYAEFWLRERTPTKPLLSGFTWNEGGYERSLH